MTDHYRITAPLVVVRSAGRIVYKTFGQLVGDVEPVDAERLIAKKMIEPYELDEPDGPADEQEAPDDDPAPDEPTPEAAAIERPRKAAPHDAWVTYAAETGQLDRAQAEQMTRAEIIAAVK